MDVSDRSLQAKLTQEAKITSASFLSEVIFTFISALFRGVLRLNTRVYGKGGRRCA